MLTHESLIAESEPYPEAAAGDLAVGYYTKTGGSWRLIPVDSRPEAEARFREILTHEDVLHVVLAEGPHNGRSSAVAWVARCNGGSDWSILEETEGMREYRPNE